MGYALHQQLRLILRLDEPWDLTSVAAKRELEICQCSPSDKSIDFGPS